MTTQNCSATPAVNGLTLDQGASHNLLHCVSEGTLQTKEKNFNALTNFVANHRISECLEIWRKWDVKKNLMLLTFSVENVDCGSQIFPPYLSFMCLCT